MKIKEIIVTEADETQAKITKVNPDKTVEITPIGGGKPFTVPVTNLTQTQQGEFQAPNPQPDVGTSITLVSPPTGQSTTTSSTSTPTSTTSTTSQSNPSTVQVAQAPQQNQEIKMSETNDEFNDLFDNELIQAATHKGMEDSLEFDDDGVLVNRDEIIDLLQNGQEFGGDPTDDFISDVKDDEYDQLLEKIKHLSGL